MATEEREVIYNEEGYSNEETAEPEEDDVLTLTRRSEFLKIHELLGAVCGIYDELEHVTARNNAVLTDIERRLGLVVKAIRDMRSQA